MQQGDSFWSDIKSYEEQLSKNPDSLLFAKLAEVYLKVGLVDDALHISRQGTAKFPDYIAGQRALALACHSKGLEEDCRQALEKVTNAQPEDGQSQKMLGRILLRQGKREAAVKAFRTVLEFNPDDLECRLELEVVEKSRPEADADQTAQIGSAPFGAGLLFDNEGAIIELSEADIYVEEQPELSEAEPLQPEQPKHDPLSTVTLADLYVQQGFYDKARDIYRSILSEDPGNKDVIFRLEQLESLEAQASQAEAPAIQLADETLDVRPFHVQAQEAAKLPAHGTADKAVSVLEQWLDNIRRIKACR